MTSQPLDLPPAAADTKKDDEGIMLVSQESTGCDEQDDVFAFDAVRTITFTSYEGHDISFTNSDLSDEDRYETTMQVISDDHNSTIDHVDSSSENKVEPSLTEEYREKYSNITLRPRKCTSSKSQSDSAINDSDTWRSSIDFTTDTKEEYHNKPASVVNTVHRSKNEMKLRVHKNECVNNKDSECTGIEINYEDYHHLGYDDDNDGDDEHQHESKNSDGGTSVDRYSTRKPSHHEIITACDSSVEDLTNHSSRSQQEQDSQTNKNHEPFDFDFQLPLLNDDGASIETDESESKTSDRYSIHRSTLINDVADEDDDSLTLKNKEEQTNSKVIALIDDSPSEPYINNDMLPDVADTDNDDDTFSDTSSYTLNKLQSQEDENKDFSNKPKKCVHDRRVSFNDQPVTAVHKLERLTTEDRAKMFYKPTDILTFRVEYILELQEMQEQFNRRQSCGSSLLNTFFVKIYDLITCKPLKEICFANPNRASI